MNSRSSPRYWCLLVFVGWGLASLSPSALRADARWALLGQATTEQDAGGHGTADHGTDDGTDEATGAVHGESDAGGHAAGGDNPLSLDPDLAIVTLVIFLVLLAILSKFAWGPITEALDLREKGIADQLADAKRNQEEALRLLGEHRSRMDQATQEVKGLLEQARRDGDALKQRIVSEAGVAAAAQKDRALREIEAAKNGALEELARKSVDQAVTLAGRIIGKQLSKDDHARMVQESLQQLPSQN